MNGMPAINLSRVVFISDAERVVSFKIVNKGYLRASKPDTSKGDYTSGCAAYVWRMVAFFTSPKSQHQCMPMCAEFDIPEDNHDRRNLICKELDELVSRIVNTIPKNEWHGVKRWGNALYR